MGQRAAIWRRRGGGAFDGRGGVEKFVVLQRQILICIEGRKSGRFHATPSGGVAVAQQGVGEMAIGKVTNRIIIDGKNINIIVIGFCWWTQEAAAAKRHQRAEAELRRCNPSQRDRVRALHDGGARRRATYEKSDSPKQKRNDDPQGNDHVIVRFCLPATPRRPRGKSDRRCGHFPHGCYLHACNENYVRRRRRWRTTIVVCCCLVRLTTRCSPCRRPRSGLQRLQLGPKRSWPLP